MRFGFAHRVMTSLLAIIGVLTLVTSGQLDTTLSYIATAATLLAIAIPERWQRHSVMPKIATVAPLVLLTIQLGRLLAGASFLTTTVEFALALQIIRIATRRGAAQDQQVVVLAWLHLIAGTILGGGLPYAVCFLGFLIVVPGALVLSHLRREVEGNYRQGARDRSGSPVDVPRILRSRRVISARFIVLTCLISVPVLLFTAVLFLALPRVGLSLLMVSQPTASRMVGFSDHVDLGGLGTLRTDPTIVLRVEVPVLPNPPPERITLYLRGTALDQYNAGAWTRSRQSRVVAQGYGRVVRVPPYHQYHPTVGMSFDLEPIDPPVLFLPPNTAALALKARTQTLHASGVQVLEGASGEMRYHDSAIRGVRYDAYFAKAPNPRVDVLTSEQRFRYLIVPPELPERVHELAKTWTEGAQTPLDKALAIQTHLKQQYTYNLNSPSGASKDPLDHFLFESKQGHCEYFSTAMALLLRQVGVPTRNVTGFVGGTYNRFGRYYSVRQGDAHSWVEAYIDGAGWSRFDPTPSGAAQSLIATDGWYATMRDIIEAMAKTWDRRVIRYGLPQQISMWQSIRFGVLRTSRSLSAVTLSFPGGKTTVGVMLPWLGAVLAAVGIGAWIYKRRRSRRVPESTAHGPQSASALAATALYEQLQRNMTQAGVGRRPAVPPLKHAQVLQQQGFVHADAIYEVTENYLRARFGNASLDDDTLSRLEKLIQTVRRVDDEHAATRARNQQVATEIGIGESRET